MTVFTIAYRSRNLISQQTTHVEAAIGRLLDTSRARNERLRITGALLFNEDRFVQILEGDEEPVMEVLGDILRDTRHTDVDVLPSRLAANRTFAQWSMAFIGTVPGIDAQAFTISKQFDWTRTTTELLSALVLDMITGHGSVVPKAGGKH